MTLIAFIASADGPVLIADALLTNSDSQPNFPLLPTIGHIQGVDEYRDVRGLSRKIVVINESLALAWSGSQSQAKDFIEAIQFDLLQKKPTPEWIRDYPLALLKKDYPGLKVIMLVQHNIQGNKFDTAILHNVTMKQHPTLGAVYAGGSGAQDFLKLVDRFNPNSRLDTRQAIALTGVLQSREMAGNGGIANRWGGAFEGISGTTTGWKPYTDILYLNWYVSNAGEITFGGTMVKVDFIGDFLILRVRCAINNNEYCYTIAPPGFLGLFDKSRLRELPDFNATYVCNSYRCFQRSKTDFDSFVQVMTRSDRNHGLQFLKGSTCTELRVPEDYHMEFIQAYRARKNYAQGTDDAKRPCIGQQST